MRPRTMGFLTGVVLAVLAWIGNLQRVDTFTVQAFPDLLTIFAVPAALYFALRRWVKTHPGISQSQLRRAGWSVTNAAAAVFAVAMAILASERVAFDAANVSIAFLSALFITAGIGYVSTEVWSRLLAI